MIFDVIVIGGGPAGLYSAAQTSASGLSTCLLEANKQAGKKLLISGQGKCNITNTMDIADFIECYGDKTQFVRKCLYAFSNNDLIESFSADGIELASRPDGKVFPASKSATEVLNYLLKMCIKSDIDLMYEHKVTKIEAQPDHFISSGDSFNLKSRGVIIASGGFTYPTTGSDGSGYKLAAKLGHKIITPRPSLTGIVAAQEDYDPFISCAGISIDCELNLFRDNLKQGAYTGKMLFTHKGVSGPVVIDNSRNFLTGDQIRLNLIPDFSYEQISSDFIKFCAARGKSGIKAFFSSYNIPDRIITAVIKQSSASSEPSTRAAELTSGDRKLLLKAFTSLSVGIRALEGKNHAMCTAGGVDTSEINPARMESKLIPGLFFAGEVIDVDGDSGGYNLQFAFSSAAAAASALIESQNRHKNLK